jgi:hypothetical protein
MSTIVKIQISVLQEIITSEKNNKGGKFVIRSISSGIDHTYRIKRNEYKGKWYTQIFVEKHYLQFEHAGHYFNGMITKKGQPSIEIEVLGIEWLLRNLEQNNIDRINAQSEIFHTGQCLKCGRPLTDAESIEIGLGPICRK